MNLTYGTVVNYNDQYLFLASSITPTVGGGVNYDKLSAYTIPTTLPIYLYNRETKQVEEGSKSNIISYEVNKVEATDIMVATNGGALKFIYIVD